MYVESRVLVQHRYETCKHVSTVCRFNPIPKFAWKIINLLELFSHISTLWSGCRGSCERKDMSFIYRIVNDPLIILINPVKKEQR